MFQNEAHVVCKHGGSFLDGKTDRELLNNMAYFEEENGHNNDFGVALPSELWLAIFEKLNPVYDDIFTLCLVCKSWRSIIFTNTDPSLWEKIIVKNVRNCSYDSAILGRFRTIIKLFGRFVKLIRLQKCHELFTEILLLYAPRLSFLTTLEITGMPWSKRLLRALSCQKSLGNVTLEGSLILEGIFNEDDLQHIAESFPQVRNLCLQYSVVKPDWITTVRGVMMSKYNHLITCLELERARIDASDLRDSVKELKGLKKFSYGNDQIHGLPSTQQLHLNSKSLMEVELFQVGDFAEYDFVFPKLKKLTLNGCTSVCKLGIDASALRCLYLLLCVEVRKLNRITANSLHELKLRRCNALIPAELISLLVRNPDIKSLELEVYWSSLRLDQHSTPSLENIKIFDNGERLTSVDIRCPKLQHLMIKKSMTRSTILKAVSILSFDVKKIVVSDVPNLRKITIEADRVAYLELNFERRLDHVKPTEYTKLSFRSRMCQLKIKHLVIKKCNLKALVVSLCNVQHISLEYCNLDCPVGDLIQNCGMVESLTLKNCYGPCQLNLNSEHLKELHVVSCTSLLMDHINLACPSLVVLNVSGLSFLPSQEEVHFIASNVRELSPFLGSIKFSH